MKGFIEEFEELVLLTISTLREGVYGVAVLEDIQKRANPKLVLERCTPPSHG